MLWEDCVFLELGGRLVLVNDVNDTGSGVQVGLRGSYASVVHGDRVGAHG